MNFDDFDPDIHIRLSSPELRLSILEPDDSDHIIFMSEDGRIQTNWGEVLI